MTYPKDEAAIRAVIQEKLEEIEQKQHVKILYAVESGSRAWHLASPDSDYDVRFIYIRPRDAYLKLEPVKDFIDWELNEVLDINGWDITKALRHFHKSNATLFEWCHSPIIYHTTEEWKLVQNTVQPYFSCKASMYHYYGTAHKNYHTYLLDEKVNYKKYFYVLRPLLACQWINQRKCPPPVPFEQLADTLLDDELHQMVEKLLLLKMQMPESAQGQRLDQLNQYIAAELKRLQGVISTSKEERLTDWQSLDELFLTLLAKMS